jgi:hypothetical protein
LEGPLHPLLRKLLATENPVEFEKLSHELRTMLHDRIEALRKDAQALQSKARKAERRKRKRNNGNAP